LFLFLEQFLDPQIFDQQIGKIEKEESSYRIGGSGSDQISSLNRLLPYSWRCAVFSNQDLRSDSAGESKGQRSSRTDLARSDRQSYKKKKRGAASVAQGRRLSAPRRHGSIEGVAICFRAWPLARAGIEPSIAALG
jgi:hypothetical protein